MGNYAFAVLADPPTQAVAFELDPVSVVNDDLDLCIAIIVSNMSPYALPTSSWDTSLQQTFDRPIRLFAVDANCIMAKARPVGLPLRTRRSRDNGVADYAAATS
jgi:hypothetical protein